MSTALRTETVLPGCRITCEVAPGSWALEDLCGFAVRHNALRRFLFVSKVLGRHWPTPPAELRRVAEALARSIVDSPPAPPVVFIGLAETATALGQAVFRAWHRIAQPASGIALYLDTTRRRTGGPVAFVFSEEHSHATAHLVHEPDAASDPHGVFRRARSLVIVDDEATTGRTAAHLARAWAGWRGVTVEELDVRLAVLTRWRPQGTVDLHEALRLHTLLDGTFTFEQTETGFSEATAQQTAPDHGPCVSRGTRHGMAQPGSLVPEVRLDAARHATPGTRHLVLGAGEFGFAPLLWAEALEAAGADVCLQAVTRSPILVGGAIHHARTFTALCGGAHREFLYNVPDEHSWDAVWLCREDAFPLPVDHPLWQVPRLREAPSLRPVENEALESA